MEVANPQNTTMPAKLVAGDTCSGKFARYHRRPIDAIMSTMRWFIDPKRQLTAYLAFRI